LRSRFPRFALYGLDSSELAVEFCNQRGLDKVVRGDLTAPPRETWPTDGFDLVMFLDVVEHIGDDIGALRAAAKLVKRNGTLLVTVPAYRFLWGAHDVVHHHKRRYTREQIVSTIRAAGFEPVFASYFNTLLFPVVAAARVAGRLFGRDTASDATLPARPINALFRAVFTWERHLLRATTMPFGVSIVVVARPKG
jgi:SAM-dependent methyltransferase